MKKIIIILCIMGLLISCFDPPPEGNDPVDETKYGYVSPSSGKLGTKVRFFNLDEPDYPIDEYRVKFHGMDALIEPDSITSTDVYTSVPFDALHGPVMLLHYELDSTDYSQNGVLIPMINHDTIKIPFFDVREYSSHIDRRLTWFDLNYTIGAEHSKYRSGKTIQEINWVGEINGDTTILTASYFINDEKYDHHISFYSIRDNDHLPELINVYCYRSYRKYGVDYVDRDYLFEGVVKLQSWDPGNLVSGRIITTLGNMNNIHFWCDFSE